MALMKMANQNEKGHWAIAAGYSGSGSSSESYAIDLAPKVVRSENSEFDCGDVYLVLFPFFSLALVDMN